MVTVGKILKDSDITFEQRAADIEREERIEAEQRQRERFSPFKNFTQLNNDMTKALISLTSKSPVATCIWFFLLDHCDKYNAVACSSKVLEEALGYSRTTIYEGIKALKASNFIDIKKMGTCNVYLLNKQVTWKSWGSNYKYAEFGAKIILSESKQEKDVQDKRIVMPIIRNDYGKHDKGSADSDKLEYDEDFDDFEAGADRDD